MNKIIVVPSRFHKGWAGPGDAEVEALTLNTGDKAFWETKYDTDALFVQYHTPGSDVQLRLTKAGGEFLRQNMPDATPIVCWLAIDVDNPGHAEWTPEAREAAISTLIALPEFETAGFYFTQRGYRLVWPLAKPLPFYLYESYLAQFHEYLRSYGLDPDPAAIDWTRLFRVPHGTREHYGLQAHESLFDNMAPLTWEAPQPLSELESVGLRHGNNSDDFPGIEDIPAPSAAHIKALRSMKSHAKYPFIMECLEAKPCSSENRYDAYMRTAGCIATRIQSEDPLEVYAIMLPGVLATIKAHPESKRGPEFLWECCILACGEFREPLVNEDPLYTDKLSEAAVAMGFTINDGGKAERHLVLEHGDRFYVWNEHEGYYNTPPVTSKMLSSALRDNCPTLAVTTQMTKKGDVTPVQQNALLYTYATSIPGEIVLEYGTKKCGKYDARTGQFTEYVGNIDTRIKAEYNPQIAHWLTLLGGDRHEEMLDWLATAHLTDKPTCALYIYGPHSVGKGLFVEGLAQLWHGSFSSYDNIAGDFQEELTKSPLVVTDESVSQGKFDMNTSSTFRKLIGSSTFSINRKYRMPVVLNGAPRFIITANNIDALKIRENLSKDDLEAVNRRIGFIKIDEAGRDYLNEIGGRDTTEMWVAGKGIARHVVWLQENRVVKHGPRYLVEGWESDFTRNLVTRSGGSSSVLIATIKYVMSGMKKPGIRVGGGEVLVNTTELGECWEGLMGREAAPSASTMAGILKSLSVTDKSVVRKVNNRCVRYWSVDPVHLYEIAESLGIADVDELKLAINGPDLRVVENDED